MEVSPLRALTPCPPHHLLSSHPRRRNGSKPVEGIDTGSELRISLRSSQGRNGSKPVEGIDTLFLSVNRMLS